MPDAKFILEQINELRREMKEEFKSLKRELQKEDDDKERRIKNLEELSWKALGGVGVLVVIIEIAFKVF